MPKARVLLVDNDPEFLRIWSELLRRRDYDVKLASSVANAKEAVSQGGLDLAILDLRLVDDKDEEDNSGLQLARDLVQESSGNLPIIILSGDPNEETFLWAVQDDRRPKRFLSVVKKNQGPDVLLKELRKAFPPRVFVSHGHDESATAEVINFLEEAGVKPIILAEQPRSSQSLLDQFEKHTNVEFAVILVTPDDIGSRKGEAARPRARQNVIFELGFFLAKLGRNRVVALCKEDGEPIEWPSDYQGVLYRDMDQGGGWQLKLARDMKAAGVDVDLRQLV